MESNLTVFIAHVSEDGYLFGTDDGDIAPTNWRFWHPAGELVRRGTLIAVIATSEERE